jgi:hypothetical protein
MFRMRSSVLAAGCSIFLLSAHLCAQKPLTPQSRVWLIRGFTAEFAVARKSLPKGQEGLRLTAENGAVDERALEIQLANNGPAVRQGEMAQVTKINFEKSAIVFEINGGGKKKRKWFQNIEVGMGTRTTPISPADMEPPTGSQIKLAFDGPVPDMTVDQVKAHLAPVLDFNQRSASLIATDSWPPEIQEAVKNHAIVAGMTKEQVIASKGRPDNKIRERKGHTEQETWIWGTPPQKILMVVFEGDEVVEAREYIPGIPATKVPRTTDPHPQ